MDHADGNTRCSHDACSDDLPKQFHFRRKTRNVIDKANGEHSGNTHEQLDVVDAIEGIQVAQLPPEEPQAHVRHKESRAQPKVQCDSSATGDGALVNTTIARLVDRPQDNGDLPRQGNRAERDKERRGENYGNLKQSHKRNLDLSRTTTLSLCITSHYTVKPL